MGSGHLNFHIHIPHVQFHHHHHGSGRKPEVSGVPKGCFAVMVGQREEQKRFIIPVIYLNHPLFMELLKEAEEEYGFDQIGPINIPCHVEEFSQVKGMIDMETTRMDYNHHQQFMCFKAGFLG